MTGFAVLYREATEHPLFAGDVAQRFVDGVRSKRNRYRELAAHESLYGASEGFVYFAAIGSPRPVIVKIGFSKLDPAKRIKQLQTGCPLPICLLGFVIGTQAQERELHQVVATDHVRGEWFAFSDYVEQIIISQLGGLVA